MDELKISLGSIFMKRMLSQFIGKMIRKKFDCDVDILINEIKFVSEDGKVKIRADIEAETTDSDFKKVISRNFRVPL